MSGFRCNACNADFENETEQRSHYRSEWHRHNLKRKVAGVPGVSEALFNMRLEALEAEKKNQGTRLIYTCSICNKSYSTAKSHEQHLRSKLHLNKAADVLDSAAVIRPAPARVQSEDRIVNRQEWKKPGSEQILLQTGESDDGSDEWEEVEDGDVDIQSIPDGEDEDMAKMEWNPVKCFFCDEEPDGTLEGCVEHMHREHGFFIPDAEFLKDPRGLLNYLGLKVTKGFMCLYCDERGKRFQSCEAARKHMISKSHCKLRYGEGDGGAEEELEDFYDFGNSHEEEGGELISVDEENEDPPVSLGPGGFELILRSSGENGQVIKTIGTREFRRYYKQRPRPVAENETANNPNMLTAGAVRAVVARYQNMGLATRQFNRKDTKNLPAVKLENMRTKVGIKNNVIRNLPKNCTH